MRIFILFLILGCTLSISAQLTIHIDAIPADTPDDAQIYVAGDFQGWDPGDPNYELVLGTDGNYSLTFEPEAGGLNFKFTRGSWDTVEGNETGGYLPDRYYNYSGAAEEITLQILTWEDIGIGPSTAADNVLIHSTDFYIPQLDRYRRIWIYLPPDYDDNDDHYPVLYMHDGQNVFDALTSFAGEWEVDETLNDLHSDGDPGIIVVAIDNGGVHRIDEYSPWVNPDYGGGEGDEYMQFIINTLKPEIDENYRTKPERQFTGLMGSSLGGLISHYGGIQYEETFSRIGIFSPSYWFAPESFTIFDEVDHELPMRIYMIAGALEGGSAASNAQLMSETFIENGYTSDEFLLTIHEDGQHSEWYWAREFGDAYLWLFADPLNIVEEWRPSIDLFPNPSSGVVQVTGLVDVARIELTDSLGRVIREDRPENNEYMLSGLATGSYLLRVISTDGRQIILPVILTRD